MSRFLHHEQLVNERIVNPDQYVPIDGATHNVRRELWPEARPVWPLEAAFLPERQMRCYGAVGAEVMRAFGEPCPQGKVPLFLHAQAPASHVRRARQYGRSRVGDVLVTPTSSYRSVLCAPFGREVTGLKLSIGAVIGKRRRALKERQIARAVFMSALLDTISLSDRATMAFDWFSEPAGAVDVESGHGYLFRRQPQTIDPNGKAWLCPAFSLLSSQGEVRPMLVDMIERSGLPPEAFVVQRVLLPYINVLAYLLFEQGIQIEGHSQNVLYELSDAGELTGKLVLRDLSDATVSVAMRTAKRKPMPDFRAFLPKDCPFPKVSNACDFEHNIARPRLLRGSDTVERYGLSGLVWSVNHSLSRFFPHYDKRKVAITYLGLWQQAAIAYLNVRPLIRREPLGLATDEALAHFLTHTDWAALGAQPNRALPKGSVSLLTDGPRPGKRRPVYERVEGPWGELFFEQGRPGFFLPAY